MRSTQWCSPIGILTMLPRLVWPVYWTGLTDSPRLSSKLGICQFWMSTYAPLFLGKACARNISQSPELHWNNENHPRQSCLVFKDDIVYRPYQLILPNIFISFLLHAINASCVSEPSLSTYYLSCELLETPIKIIPTIVSCCGRIIWPNCYKVNRSPQSWLDDDQITLEPLQFVFILSSNMSWIMQMSNNKLFNY